MDIKNLKARKKALKLTTAQLAYMAELPVSTVSKIMTGETKNPSFVTVERISEVITREEARRRVMAYRQAMWEYMKSSDEDEGNGLNTEEFDDIYRTEHNLDDAPIPLSVPKDRTDLINDNLAYSPERLYTVSEFDSVTQDRFMELIDGHMVIHPFPNIRHQNIVQNMGRVIDRFIYDNNGNCHMYNVGVGVTCPEDDFNYLVPDLIVICDDDRIHEEGNADSPDWVVEVVSESTADNDYKIKKNIYRKWGVSEYWIIDPYKERVTVFVKEDAEDARIYGFDDEIPVSIYVGRLKIRIRDLK